MKYKKFGKVLLAAVAIVALAFSLAACYDGEVLPEPTLAPNPSTAPIATVTGSPDMGGDLAEKSPDVNGGIPQTTTVPLNPDAKTTFDAGIYTAKAKGMNGDVDVKVTFSDNAIVSVEVTNHKETEGIYEKPVEDIPRAITGGQTLNVDTVSGATYTSKAIIEAVTDCVVQANGDVEALGGKRPANGTNKSPSPSP